MAQSLVNKKADFATKGGSLATQLLQLKSKIDLYVLDWFGEGFSTGPNAIIQADLTFPNDYLTPAILANLITALQAIQTALPNAVVQNVQQAAPGEPF